MMMKRYMLRGCGTALITPFINGRVDFDAYVTLVRRQVDAGIDFLVPLGSTAETPCLDDAEKVELLDITKSVGAELPVVAGVGTNSLRATVRNMHLLDGADMFLVVVPYYNKPTQTGIFEYYKTVASETDKPIVLYNVPSRTGVNMNASTTARLAEIDNIVAIKEASGNLSQVRDVIGAIPSDFAVLSGNDDQTLDIVLEGGHGVISVASNVAPAMMVEMTRKALDGDLNGASVLFRRLIPLFDACFVESNPIPVKAALWLMGYVRNELRLPLTLSEPSTIERMAGALTRLGVDLPVE